MNPFQAYKDPRLVTTCLSAIHKEIKQDYYLMEVCGGHTHAIHKFGLPDLLPSQVHLISGPGCPVCVTHRGFIDQAITLSQIPNNLICTYGDLIRVPGSQSSLEVAKTTGAQVKVVLSALECIRMAQAHPEKEFVFLGIGFETTAPATAISIIQAQQLGLTNFSVLSAHKTMPAAMAVICELQNRLDGFICPGHVSAITGAKLFDFIPRKYAKGCVVSGFDALDLLETILLLIQQVNLKHPKLEIQYRRAVSQKGNTKAMRLLETVFENRTDYWRGLGEIPNSGLGLKEAFAAFDANRKFDLSTSIPAEPKACKCGKVLTGQLKPTACRLFGSTCTPNNPIGACMVSNEGACHAHYKYQSFAV